MKYDTRTARGFPVTLTKIEFSSRAPGTRETPEEPEGVTYRVTTRRGQPADFLRISDEDHQRWVEELFDWLNS